MLSRLAVVLILWISLLTGISRADDEVAFEVIHEVSFRVTTQTFTSDHENRLIVVVDRLTGSFSYSYVHRPSGVLPNEAGSRAVPLVVAKLNLGGWGIINGCEGSATNPAVETMRGSDMGGGVGGVLYTRLENGQISFNHYNSRGDLTAQTTGLGSLSWAASYRGDGTRSAEVGNAIGRQRANTKDEDPTGLLNEGMRYRDLEFGIFLTRDPAGFVDGPNVYTYVRQNPWTMFDPYGLNAFADYMGDVGMTVKGVGVGFSKTAWSSVTGFGKLAWRNNPLVNLGQLVKGSKTGYQSNWEDGKAALGVGYDLATSSEARAAAGQAVDDYLYEATKSPGKMGEMLIGPGLAFAVEAAVGAKGLDKLAKLNAVDDGLGALSKVDEALGVTTARETVEVVASKTTAGSTQPFKAYLGEGNVGIQGTIDEFGMVDFTYMTGPGTPRGAQMFNEMLEHFGSNVIGVRGSWAGGGELSTNFDVYKAAIGRNLSPEEAAALTPTGKNATRAGFGKINIFTDNENEVLLEFTR